MYCHQCGKEVGDASFCPYCGTNLKVAETQVPNYQQPVQYARNDDAPNAGFAILSFFIPVVGLVLFCVWNKDYPKKAASCIKGFIANIVLDVVVVCCFLSFGLGALASYDNNYESHSRYDYDYDDYDYYDYDSYDF